MRQPESPTNLASEQLPQESPSLHYPSQLGTDEHVTPPYSQQPLTQPNDLMLQVLQAPVLNGEKQKNSDEENMAPAIPPRKQMEGSLTQDMRDKGRRKNNEEESQRCLVDFVEWWCHKITSSDDVKEIKEAEMEFQKAMANLPSKPRSFGRLYNRLQLVALSLDAGVLRPGKKPEGSSESYFTGDLGPDTWNMYREQLILLKSLLLRQDANVDDPKAEPNAAPDAQREQHPLFQKDYRKVGRLLRVQECLSVFRQRLLDSSKDRQAVEKAMDEYEGKINVLFGEASPSADDSSIASLVSQGSDIRQLPQELVGFLLKDLYRKSTSEELRERLLNRVELVTFGNGPYSHSETRRSFRGLLSLWQEHVLETPTLVELGYGTDPKTASPSRKQAEAEEDAMLRRLSTCGGEAIENVSDFGDSDSEDEQVDTRKRKTSPSQVANQKNKKAKESAPQKWDTYSDEEDVEDGSSSSDGRINKKEPPFHVHRGSMQELSSLYAKSRRRTPLKEPPAKKRPRSPLSLTSDPEDPTFKPQKPQQRRAFTDEETQAIIDGVRRYGEGKWRLIKDNCDGVLDRRDTVQIKDKARNLKNNGLL